MNLLQNGSLELDREGVPAHWTLEQRELGNHTRVTAARVHGLDCLRIESPAHVDDWRNEGVVLTQTVPTEPDTVYTLSLPMHNLDFHTGDGSPYLRAFAALYDALPDEPRYAALRDRLREASVAAVNRMTVEQCPHGGLPFKHGQPETARAVSSPAHALIRAQERMGIDTSNLLYGLMAFYGTPTARQNFEDPKRLVLAVQHSTGMYLAWAAKEGGRG